ncbi:MAG: hydroxymethylpyrimidine/phosphomethylpyrimidine kinase [Aureispira sp.]
MSSITTALRPYVLSIAGFDPSGGAGLVADAKAMEAQGVYGLTVATAITVQHESAFEQVEWLDSTLIISQIKILFQQYPIYFCKIGLIENWDLLQLVVATLRSLQPTIFIAVDPIFRASAGFDFNHTTSSEALKTWLPSIHLLTPNAQELARMDASTKDLLGVAQALGHYTAILYKGGHNKVQKGVDILWYKGSSYALKPTHLSAYEKHGSGCVLSASIIAHLAKGKTLLDACRAAKHYITLFLDSNPSLLGYHYHNNHSNEA